MPNGIWFRQKTETGYSLAFMFNILAPKRHQSALVFHIQCEPCRDAVDKEDSVTRNNNKTQKTCTEQNILNLVIHHMKAKEKV